MKRKPILIAQEAAVSLAQKTAPQASRWGAAPTPTFAERAEMEQIDSFGAAGGSEALSRPHQAGGLFVVKPALQVQGYQAAEPSPILGGAPTTRKRNTRWSEKNEFHSQRGAAPGPKKTSFTGRGGRSGAVWSVLSVVPAKLGAAGSSPRPRLGR